MNPDWRMCQAERCWHPAVTRFIWRCTRPVHFDDHHCYRAVAK